MSIEKDEKFPEEYPGQYAEFLEVFHLAEYLEQFAQSYSEDYADELEDGCGALKGSIDLGGELTTAVSFKAERVREELYKGFYGRVITAEYEVKSSIKQSNLTYASFPEHVRECINEMDEFEDGYLDDETTQFAIEFELTHKVTSEGDFLHEQALLIHIDEAVLRFPDAVVVGASEDEYEALTIEPDTLPGGVAETIDRINDDALAEVLSFEDILAFDALAKQVVVDHNNSQALDRFYQQIDAIRYLSKAQRMSMVRNIAEQLFLPEAA